MIIFTTDIFLRKRKKLSQLKADRFVRTVDRYNLVNVPLIGNLKGNSIEYKQAHFIRRFRLLKLM